MAHIPDDVDFHQSFLELIMLMNPLIYDFQKNLVVFIVLKYLSAVIVSNLYYTVLLILKWLLWFFENATYNNPF
jgi:hypothetical protein